MLFLLTALALTTTAHAKPNFPQFRFETARAPLHVRVLSDEVLQFEWRKGEDDQAVPALFAPTPYLAEKDGALDFPGPTEAKAAGNTLETPQLKLTVKPETSCVEVLRQGQGEAARICLQAEAKAPKFNGLTLRRGTARAVYGLGEYFDPKRLGRPDGNWLGHRRVPGKPEGNAMVPLAGGSTGNNQFPIMYSLGEKATYAIFLNQLDPQTWDFTKPEFRAEVNAAPLSFFYLGGEDLPALRTKYMALTGRPPVPPKTAFGLWVSEYGYDNWDEVRDKLRTLREHRFPTEGFVLDLQWFGNVKKADPLSKMGNLAFDETHFPKPKETIAAFAKEGIQFLTIEEPYVSRGLPEHQRWEERGLLLKDEPGKNKAFLVSENPWWGLGGLIDYTNPETGRTVHEEKRRTLVDYGIVGHWTDLGEPEIYRQEGSDRFGTYHGFPELGRTQQAEVQNAFGIAWAKSIFEGYSRANFPRRPWILARAGGSGIERYGAGMWSADIGANFKSLRSHLNAQMQMSLSGIDYFGSDLGGFHRAAIKEDKGASVEDLYTQWFAVGAQLDVPVRPHTENMNNTKETAPDRIGDRESNLNNIRLRYELSPYYYSLAHRAYLYGEPLAPPVAYYYPRAPKLKGLDPRELAAQKMLGRDLLAGAAPASKGRHARIYLPPGEWFDYFSGESFTSEQGRLLPKVSLYAGERFRLPLYARAGALVPLMHVDAQTQNLAGRRADGSVRDELIVRAFPSRSGEESGFTLFEDDGTSVAYQRGGLARTELKQSFAGKERRVTIAPSDGNYAGMPEKRAYVVQLVAAGKEAAGCRLTVNGQQLPRFTGREAYEQSATGAYLAADGVLSLKSGPLPVREAKEFRVNCEG